MQSINPSIELTLRIINYLLLTLFTLGLFLGWYSKLYFAGIRQLKPIIRYTLVPYVAVLFSLLVLSMMATIFVLFLKYTSQNPIDMIIVSINALVGTSYTFIVYAFLTAPKGKAIVCKVQSIIAIVIAYYLDRFAHDWLFHGRPWLSILFVFIVAIVVYYRFFKNGRSKEFIAEEIKPDVPPVT